MSVPVWSHPLYRWYNTHFIYDIPSTVYMAQYALYMTSHPWFMTSQQSTHDIKAVISHLTPIISDSTSTVSLSSHPDYRPCNPHCMYDNTATICMTSYELHMTSHPLFLISHHAMTSHPLYSCHHTQDTCHHIHCSWTITYNVLIIPHLLYMWHQTHHMYDITWILCDTHTHTDSYDITILYSWLHIHSLHDSIPTLSDITYCTLATLQPLYLWQDTSYVYDIILNIYDIAIVHEWQYNHSIHHHTHCICVIQPTRLMISQTMYVWNLPQCM